MRVPGPGRPELITPLVTAEVTQHGRRRPTPLTLSLAGVRAIVDGLTLNREEAAAWATGMLLATDVADYLVRRGLPFRRAHEVTGALVRKLVSERREFEIGRASCRERVSIDV